MLEKELINESIKIIIEEDLLIEKALPVSLANKQAMIWLKPGSAAAYTQALEVSAGLVICDQDTYERLAEDNKAMKNFVLTANPKRIFSKLVHLLLDRNLLSGIHASAVIHPNASLGENLYIGPNTVVGNCIIGDNTVIHGNCYLFDGIRIGNNVIVNPGVVIGSDGFGYSKEDDGTVVKFPHIGSVVIMDDVEIGANTCIDRGALTDTVVHRGVKIDNLVHIAHNVIIFENAFIIANAMLGGSVEVGKNAWIAPSASVLQQLKIGADATIGVGAVVTKNVPAEEVWAGAPAKPIKEFIEMQKALKAYIDKKE